ncbi:hypothetical protein Mgra_00007912, partial [Meloidogyne graminicola]
FNKGLHAGQLCAKGVKELNSNSCPHFNINEFDREEITIKSLHEGHKGFYSLNVRWINLKVEEENKNKINLEEEAGPSTKKAKGNENEVFHALIDKSHCAILKKSKKTISAMDEIYILEKFSKDINSTKIIYLYG